MYKLLLAAFITMAVALPAQAVQLLNFHNQYCAHCVRFQTEIGKEAFEADPQALGVKMVVLDYSETPPKWLVEVYGKQIKAVPGTPGFILWDEDKKVELGRFLGYGGIEWFWANYNRLMLKAGGFPQQ